MVSRLLLSQTVCFGHSKAALPLGQCLAASWQRRAQRWLSNGRIDVEVLYSPLVLWAIQPWQKPGHSLHLALDTTVLWNRFCVVMASVVWQGRACFASSPLAGGQLHCSRIRAIPLFWQTLKHPSASVSAEVVIALLGKADQLLAPFDAITLLAPRAIPSAELLAWFSCQTRGSYVMRLRADTWIQGTHGNAGHFAGSRGH